MVKLCCSGSSQNQRPTDDEDVKNKRKFSRWKSIEQNPVSYIMKLTCGIDSFHF